MRDTDIGKRMHEEAIFEQILETFPLIARLDITDEWEGEAAQIEGSPDFIVGVRGKPMGIEIAEIRGMDDDPWDYVSEAYRIASKKNKSYSRRGLFTFPIVLILFSSYPPLYEMAGLIEDFLVQEDFERLEFAQVWAADFSSEYYTPGHPFRMADMFCFKPAGNVGFHRLGPWGRKPFG